MIKRRFYREEHGERDDPSSGSSSSSDDDSEVEAEATEESDDHAAVAEAKENDEFGSASSGLDKKIICYSEILGCYCIFIARYESGDSSADEVDADTSGYTNEDDGTGNNKKIAVGPQASGKHGADILNKGFNDVAEKESAKSDMLDFVLKFKSVYKCRICPQIVCLTEETIKTHLNSKRHARSEKLLKENKLKSILNSDGEIENQETAAEMNARIVALGQNKTKRKNKGRQRQKNRTKKKKGKDVPNTEKTKGSTKPPAKKRRKSEN